MTGRTGGRAWGGSQGAAPDQAPVASTTCSARCSRPSAVTTPARRPSSISASITSASTNTCPPPRSTAAASAGSSRPRVDRRLAGRVDARGAGRREARLQLPAAARAQPLDAEVERLHQLEAAAQLLGLVAIEGDVERAAGLVADLQLAVRGELGGERGPGAGRGQRRGASAPPRPSSPRPPGRACPRPRARLRRPGSSRSSTRTRTPRRAARHAQARPITPPPTTIASRASGPPSVRAAASAAERPRRRAARLGLGSPSGTVAFSGSPLPGGRFRATIPAPALPGSGSDGRRPDAALSAPAHGAPVVPPWYSGDCETAGAMAIDRDQRLRTLEAARLYFVCEGQPGGRDPGPLLDAALRGGADIVQLREKSPALRRGADRPRRPLPPRGRRARRAVHPQRPPRPGRGLRRRRRPRRAGRHAGGRGSRARRPRGAGRALHPLPRADRGGVRGRRRDRPDQISVGPVWETPTKAGRPATGLGLIEHAAGEATIPVVRDRRDRRRNVAEVAAAGAERIVVVRAIRDAEDPEDRRARACAERSRPASRGGGADGQPRAKERAERHKRKARVGRAAEPRSPPATRSETGPLARRSSRWPEGAAARGHRRRRDLRP